MGKINVGNITAGLNKVKSVSESLSNVSHFEMVPIEYIEAANYNPFAEEDTDQSRYEVAMSIMANGLIEPLAVNKKANDKYKLISGEHRFTAIKQYLSDKFKNIPCMVFDGISDDEAELKLYEANSHREYTSEQKFKRYQELEKLLIRMKDDGKYHGGIQKGLAERLGVTTRQVRKYQTIAENLSPEQQQAIMKGELSINDAYKAAKPESESVPESDDVEMEPEKSGTSSAFENTNTTESSEVPVNATIPSEAIPSFEEYQKPENEKSGTGSAFPSSSNVPAQKYKHRDKVYFIKECEEQPDKFAAYFKIGNSQDILLGSLPDSYDTFQQAQHELDLFAATRGYEEVADNTNATGDVMTNTSSATKSNQKEPFQVSKPKAIYENPKSFKEAVALLDSLPYYPQQPCAYIDQNNGHYTIKTGFLDHFEVFGNALRVCILTNCAMHSYTVGMIATDLFIGEDSHKQALHFINQKS